MVEPTHLKNISEIGSSPQVGVKIKIVSIKPPPSLDIFRSSYLNFNDPPAFLEHFPGNIPIPFNMISPHTIVGDTIHHSASLMTVGDRSCLMKLTPSHGYWLSWGLPNFKLAIDFITTVQEEKHRRIKKHAKRASFIACSARQMGFELKRV